MALTARNVRLRELLVGIEGVALLRHLYDGTDEATAERLTEIGRLLDDDEFAAAEPISEADPQTGYRLWSDRYDEPGNIIIGLEEPAVWRLVDAVPPGRAGIGRVPRVDPDRVAAADQIG